MYTVVYVPYTRQAVYAAVYTARVHEHVHGQCTRLCTGRVNGRPHGRFRPCTRRVHDRVMAVYTVHVHVYTCTRPRVHGRYATVNGPCGHLNGRERSVYGPCRGRVDLCTVTGRVRGGAHGPCTRLCTRRCGVLLRFYLQKAPFMLKRTFMLKGINPLHSICKQKEAGQLALLAPRSKGHQNYVQSS